MGKYMKKNKMGGAVIDISLGVLTRARTLALEQQQQEMRNQVLNFCYLELRSRKLEKVECKPRVPRPSLPKHSSKLKQQQQQQQVKQQQQQQEQQQQQVKQKQQQQQQRHHHHHHQQQQQNASSIAAAIVSVSRSNSCSSTPQGGGANVVGGLELRNEELDECCQAEASCGDNALLDHDAVSSRDSFGGGAAAAGEHHGTTTGACDGATLPLLVVRNGSAAEGSAVARRLQVGGAVTVEGTQAAVVSSSMTPSQQEIDSFFEGLEDAEAMQLCERYNYDFVNDVPLPGRFEWIPTATATAAAAAATRVSPAAATAAAAH